MGWGGASPPPPPRRPRAAEDGDAAAQRRCVLLHAVRTAGKVAASLLIVFVLEVRARRLFLRVHAREGGALAPAAPGAPQHAG